MIASIKSEGGEIKMPFTALGYTLSNNSAELRFNFPSQFFVVDCIKNLKPPISTYRIKGRDGGWAL